MPQFVSPGLIGRLGGSGGGGGAAVLPTIVPLSTYWEAETNTFATAIGGATDAEKYAIDRFIKHCKQAGFWTRNAGGSNTGIWLMCQDTEAKCLVNLLHPGTKDLTKVGTPTFAAFDGVSTANVANYYESAIAINTVAQNSACLGGVCLTDNAGASGGSDMGAIDSGGTTRLTLTAKTVTTNVRAGAIMAATVTAIGASTDFSLPAPVWFSRTGSANFAVGNWTQKRITQTSTSIAPVAATTVSFLFAKGATSYSRQKWGMFWLLDGLTDTEAANLAAAAQVLVDGFRFGLPKIQPAGYGDAAVTVDALFNGNNIYGAYEYKRQFPADTVAVLCDYTVESVEQIGGMCAGGLDWSDITPTQATPSSGLWYEMTRQANIRQGSTPGNTRAGTSVASQSWNIQNRRMVDPVRQTGIGAGATASLPGLDIPIFFSDGIRGMTQDKIGLSGTLTTHDGRVFTFDRICEGGYDGDVIYHYAPYTIGREAGGTGKENLNGWRPTQRSKPRDNAGNLYDIDPYVTIGVSASGLLYGMQALPAYTTGQAYPGLQSMNIRQQAVDATSNKGRRANWGGGPILATPRGYDATRYEGPARCLKAITDAGRTQTKIDFMSFSPDGVENVCTGPYGSTLDLNNGTIISTDNGGNGWAYAAAGQSIAARKAVLVEATDYNAGYGYFIAHSGDSRVAAAIVTSMTVNFGLDASAFLDYHSIFPMHISKAVYRRNPIYHLNNAASGGVTWDANDGTQTDGEAPRISNRVVSMVQYSFDQHAEIWAPFDDGGGTLFWRFGSFSDGSQGNTNFRTPVPAEACMAVEADCPIMVTSTCPSSTIPMLSAYRMEAHQALAEQVLAIIMGISKRDGVSVQDALVASYAEARGLVLANPDSVPALLTQTT